MRWCERKGFETVLNDYQAGEEAGIKSATFSITGEYAYGLMTSEIGVHRLVRISPFDQAARRHTSFASVFVSPEIDDTIDVVVKPEDIRNFHKANYYLANMGTIASFPKSVPVSTVLSRVDAILNKVEGPRPKAMGPKSLDDLPKPESATTGKIAYGEYPHRNDQQPSPMGVWWPAERKLDANDEVLAGLFFDNIASDPTSNLYKLFIDSKSRKMDIGAKQIFNSVGDVGGNPIYIVFTDVSPANFTDEKLTRLFQDKFALSNVLKCTVYSIKSRLGRHFVARGLLHFRR